MNKEGETQGGKKEKAGGKPESGVAVPKVEVSVEIFSDTVLSIFRKLLTIRNLRDLPVVVKKIDKEFPDGNIPTSIVDSFARRLDLLKSDSEVQVDFADETAIRRLIRSGDHKELGRVLRNITEKESGHREKEKDEIKKDVDSFVDIIEKGKWVGKEGKVSKNLGKIEDEREATLKAEREKLRGNEEVSSSMERVSGRMIDKRMKVVEKISQRNVASTVKKLKRQVDSFEKKIPDTDSLQKLALFKSKRAIEIFEKIQKVGEKKGKLSPEGYSHLSSEELFILQRMFVDENIRPLLPKELVVEAEEVYRESRVELESPISAEEHLKQVKERGFGREMSANDVDRIADALRQQDELFDVMFDSRMNLRQDYSSRLEQRYGSRGRGGRFEALFPDLSETEMFDTGPDGRWRVNPEYNGSKEDIYTEWFQTTLVEVRKLAKESVETRDFYFDERAQKYLTLLSVEGIPAKYKQRVRFDMKQYHAIEMMYGRYIDDEAFQTLLSVWSENSPDYALFSELKRNERFYIDSESRKEEIGEFNVFDFVKHIGRRADNDFILDVVGGEIPRDKYGKPKYDVSRSWGTMLLKFNDSKKRTEVRREFFETVLRDKLGSIEKYSDYQMEGLYESYEDYIDRSIYYLIAANELGEIVGNTSFAEDKFQLPQGLPEFFYKTDRRLLRYFLAKYGVHVVPEAIAVLDISVSSLPQYARGEIMNHFVNVNPSDEGVPGALGMFFRGNDENKEKAEAFVKIVSGAMNDWGKDTDSNFLSFGKRSDPENKSKTAMKASNGIVVERLGRLGMGERIEVTIKDGDTERIVKVTVRDMVNSIDFVEFENMTGLEINGNTPDEKWKNFIKNFNDDYYSFDTFYAKRVQDYQHKYRGKNHPEWYSEVGIPLATDPFNMENVMKMILTVDGMTDSSGIRDRAMRVIFNWIARDLGPAESIERYDLKEGSIQWSGNAEFPDVKTKEMRNINIPGDPIKKRSIYESRKGREVTKELKKIFIDDGRAQGLLKDDKVFRKYKRRERVGVIWPHQWSTPVGFTLNILRTPGGILWRLPAEILGLTPREFRQILFEEGVVATVQLIWKHLNS